MSREEDRNEIKNRVKNEGVKGAFFSMVRDNAVVMNKQLRNNEKLKKSQDIEKYPMALLQFATGGTVSMLRKYNMFETFSTLFDMESTKKSGQSIILDEIYISLIDIVNQVINEDMDN